MNALRTIIWLSILLSLGTSVPVQAQSACCPLFDGRVAWWPGDGNALDSLGVYNGTLVNGAGFAPGRHGLSFSLDGIDDRVDLGSDQIIGSGSDPFTVSMWVNLTSSPVNYIFLARFRQDTQFILAMVSASVSGQPGNSFIGTTFRGLSHAWYAPIIWSAFLGRWAHVAVVYTGGDKNVASSYQFYIDGQMLSGMFDVAGHVAGEENDNGLGYDPFPGTGRDILDGQIDDVQVFNRVLTPEEVQALYSGDLSAAPDPTVDGPAYVRLLISPNPTSGESRIVLPAGSENWQAIEIFGITGRLVRRLDPSTAGAGDPGVHWNGLDQLGRPVPSGLYHVLAGISGGRRAFSTLAVVR